ncbi:MAG: PEP-CTERM sorting domain-containing protein [Aliishimia sp.]
MNFKTLCAAAFLTLAPAIASAVPIYADQAYSFGGTLAVGGQTIFSFEVMEDVNIADFALTASDTNGGFDILNASFDYFNVVGDTFDNVMSSSGTLLDRAATGTGSSFLTGWGGYMAGDVITFTFNDGIEDDISLGLSFQTTTPVPMPASGLLLAAGLAGGTIVLRRKRKTPPTV